MLNLYLYKRKNMRGLIFCFTIYAVSIFAQPYGNEWIDYSKTYYKFYSDYTGLLRIPYETLSATDITLEAEGLHLYNRGEEIPIWVSSNGTLQEGDYIEFYASSTSGNINLVKAVITIK